MPVKPLPAILLIAAACAFGQTDIYHPYRFANRWTADTLFVGASFRYAGGSPLTVTLQWSESNTPGRLYVISPADGSPVLVMTSQDPVGTSVNLSALAGFQAGNEVVFFYQPEGSPGRYTGPSRPGSPYYNAISSETNPDPNLRFGHRFSVAGRLPNGDIEFGIEDYQGIASDMDFNDVHFILRNAQLLLYLNNAKKRYYVW
jgi:hypothetical protein